VTCADVRWKPPAAEPEERTEHREEDDGLVVPFVMATASSGPAERAEGPTAMAIEAAEAPAIEEQPMAMGDEVWATP
jgi:hypothetical protein